MQSNHIESDLKVGASLSANAFEELSRKQTIQAFKLQRKQRLQALVVKRVKNFTYLKVL